MADTGRPTVMDDIAIQKLESAFLNGATDLQACFIANISKSTFYSYLKEHPEFSDRIEMLKEDTKIRAKMAIRDAIFKEEKPETAKWYLERKDKEFSQRIQTEHSGSVEIKTITGMKILSDGDRVQDKDTESD